MSSELQPVTKSDTQLQYLEYETVLGPAADSDHVEKQPTNMNQAGPGVPALTGGAVPAQSMMGTTSTPAPSGPTLATQGAGLGDLLTHGDSAQVGEELSFIFEQDWLMANITVRRHSTWKQALRLITTIDLTELRGC